MKSYSTTEQTGANHSTFHGAPTLDRPMPVRHPSPVIPEPDQSSASLGFFEKRMCFVFISIALAGGLAVAGAQDRARNNQTDSEGTKDEKAVSATDKEKA